MVLPLALSVLLGTSLSAAVPPQRITQTVQVDGEASPQTETHAAEPGSVTVRHVEAGRVTETTFGPQARILIELQARPLRDRLHPGSLAEAARQREQLGRDLAALDARIESRSASQITREFHTLFSGVAATVDAQAIAEIRRLPNVVAVHEDAEVRANLTESVPLIGAPAVWAAYGVTGAGVKVAVIDTGIDYTHPDLGGCLGQTCKVAGGYDFVNNDEDPRDDNGHGTHVAGIIAAHGGVEGVAPGATLLAYKVLNSNGSGRSSDIIAAIELALADGAKVANLSLGGSGDPSDPASQAIDNASAAGMLSVVAAGNSGPRYVTVTSPGVARTALTVGAADKSSVMAYFSSRGYVMDGEQLLMKPEVVAPGVDIFSTVPAAGSNGSPKRYRRLSGTSMATPHVAGAAALLLEWNAAQTPADIKNRLANSARKITGDPFTCGSGMIDLPAAFGLRGLTSTANVPFGLIDATSGVVTREQTVTIRNADAASRTFSLSTSGALPAGATLELLPSSLTLQPGASAEVLLRLRVDAAVTPIAPEPLAWSTDVVISDGERSARLPAYFFKGAMITISLDEAPWFVDLLSSSGSPQRMFVNGTTATALVAPGRWDVQVNYVWPFALVVREQQNVQGRLGLSVARGEAVHTLAARKVDDQGQPLRPFTFDKVFMLGFPSDAGLPKAFSGTFTDDETIRVSDLSSRYTVGFVGGGADESGLRFFSSAWVRRGLAADVTLPLAGVPWRPLAQSAALPPSSASALLFDTSGIYMDGVSISIGFFAGHAMPGELSRTLYLQSSVPADLRAGCAIDPFLWGYDAAQHLVDRVEGADIKFNDPANLEVDRSVFNAFQHPPVPPEVVLGPAVQRWDLDPAPVSLPIPLAYSSWFGGTLEASWTTWQTQTLSTLPLVAGTGPTFSLYRNGSPAGTYPLFRLLQGGISTSRGPTEIRASMPYRIGAVSGSSDVTVSLDTSKTLDIAPVVSRFRVEQNGMRTATPRIGPNSPTPIVKFRAQNPATSSSAVLEWRQSGAASWTSLPLTGTAPDFEAPLPMSGSVDLRVTVTDSGGNVFQETWAPAMITMAAGPPAPPTGVTATRSGTASISIAWTASANQSGIAGYRIERLPDHRTFTTNSAATYIDTDGLLPGSAYLYRVSSVDTENAVSAPSAYDLASLIDLQDDPLLVQRTVIRGVHIAELRRAVDAVREAAGLPRHWTSYDAPNGLINAADLVELRELLNYARTTMQLPAVQWSDPVAAGAIVRARTLQELRAGVR